jgi:hypothetical protein
VKCDISTVNDLTGCGKMTQVGNSSIFSNQDSTTYRSIFDSRSPEITTLVHFSAACKAVGGSKPVIAAVNRCATQKQEQN